MRQRLRCVVFVPGDRLPDCFPEQLRAFQTPGRELDSIRSKFPQTSHFIEVRPSLVHAEGFAVYSQFLHSVTACGDPLGYTPAGCKALLELRRLVDEALRGSHVASGAPLAAVGNSALEGASEVELDVVGFSRGGCVLNQILSELCFSPAATPNGTAPLPLVSEDAVAVQTWGLRCVRSLHFVDCSLNGRGVFLAEPRLLRGLAPNLVAARARAYSEDEKEPLLRVCLYGSWRHWGNPRQPWLTEERQRLVHFLRESSVVEVTERLFPRSELPRSVLVGEGDLDAAGVSKVRLRKPTEGQHELEQPSQTRATASEMVALLAHLEMLEIFDPSPADRV